MDTFHPDDLTPEQRELLAYLLEDEDISFDPSTVPVVAGQVQTGIRPRPEVIQAPLSFAQQRLWFIDQLTPGNPVYNIPAAYRLNGDLNAQALEDSLNEIIRRHAVLRTTFEARDGQPVQVIAPHFRLALASIDISATASAERPAELQRQIAQYAWQGFDLRTGPLLRAVLFRESLDQHVLLVLMHHSVADGWSMNIFLEELAANYAAFSNDISLQLPQLPVQYADYAIWQREWLQGEMLEKQVGFWKQELTGAVTALDFPTDRPRPAMQTFAGAIKTLTLDKATRQALEQFSQQNGLTLFMSLAAAFGILLMRYTRQKDVLVGIPSASRTQREIEPLIGYFANSLVLRFQAADDETIKTYLQRVKATTLKVLAHQDIPFEKIVEELQPERDLSRNPLFQVMFALEKAGGSFRQTGTLHLSPVTIETGVSRVDFSLVFTESSDGLSGSCEYSTDLFDGSSIERLLAHYRVILQAMLVRPAGRISAIEMVTEAERAQILGTWNDTRRETSETRLAHQLFEAHARENPRDAAVIATEREISFATLNQRANQIARYLRRLGVGRETVVGVLLERSIDSVLAQLAVMKAGGAFMPLDYAYPTERLAFMIDESRAKVIISVERMAHVVTGAASRVIQLDGDWPAIAQENNTDLENVSSDENLAYVIYTSGSTGAPKGVMIQHHNLKYLIQWHHSFYKMLPGERAGYVASPSFDASVMEVWPVLTAGSTIVIVETESRYNPTRLKTWLNENRIKLSFVPTIIADMLLSEPWLETTSVEYIFTGGDKLMRRPLEDFKPQFINHYGPTETTVIASFARIGPGPNHDIPPIGRPISNAQLYILDEDFNLVPPGVPGELCVGGQGVGRGYLSQPGLSAEKFVPNPFSHEPGARLYRTGDLCTFLPDGNIHFIGRIDHQVKIRGLRIELGEIKAALLQYPGIRDAFMHLWQDRRNEKRLVAYFIARNDSAIALPALRKFLKERLPSYMVPSVFIEVDAWPTNTNAKFDVRALPAPELHFEQQGDVSEAPTTDLEKKLSEIWCAILGIAQIGLHDNFFDLGGHSLLAMQLIGRIDSTLGLRLPLAAFFQSPTVAGVADTIQAQHGTQKAGSLVAIQPKGTKKPLFFIHGGMGTVIPFYEFSRHLNADQPVYALQAQGLIGEQPAQVSIESMARDYLAEIRQIQPEGPYSLCGWSMGGLIAFEMGRQLDAIGQNNTNVIMLDSGCPSENETFSEVANLQGFSIGLLDQPIHIKPNTEHVDDWLKNLLAQGIQNKKLAESTSLEEIRRLYRVYRDNVLASYHYRPTAYPAMFTLLRAADSLENHATPFLGWEQLIGISIKVLDTPGNHYSLLREPHAQALAGSIHAQLEM
jgi:amino acid adenylation domain-containing protein